jgi:hypothetical protein
MVAMRIQPVAPLLVGAFAALLACNAASTGAGGETSQTVTLVFTSSPEAVSSGQTATFAATVTGVGDTSVTWGVEEASGCGTISAAGLYSAPLVSAETSCHVVAASRAVPNVSDHRAVRVVPVQPSVAISISPASASLVGGQSQTFTTTVTGTSDTAVTWSLQEASGCGSVVGGVYASPVVAAAVTCHVLATSHADPSKTAAAAVAVSVSPQAAAPTFSPAAGTYTSSVAVTLASSTAGAVIRYTTDGSTPSAASTRYTAPFTLTATTTVRALAQATGYRDSTVSVATYAVTTPTVAVAIDPTSASALSGGVVTFTATVTGTGNTAVTWSVEEASCGSVTSGGVYTAPTVGGTTTCHVRATSQADGSKYARATVTVSVPPQAAAPTFSPAAGTYTSSVAVTLASSTAGAVIRYTTDGSTPSAASTRYTAPFTLTTTTTVRALAQATGYRDSTVSSATYAITTPTVAVAVTPTTASAVSGEVLAFTATVTGTGNTAVTWSVEEASCGSVTSGGAYSAPTVSSTTICHVRATSQADGSKYARATVTVTATPPDALAILAGRAIYFGHQSVGANIMNGVRRAVAASSGTKPTVASVGTAPAAGDMQVGRWDEGYVGANYDPISKINAFQTVMLSAAGGALDGFGGGKSIAMMKFCFVDVQGSWYASHGDADLFAAYQAMVATVQAQRPNVRLVHFTIPLCYPDSTDNAKREAYNARLRAAYGTGVFDLAKLESTDPGGNAMVGANGRYAYQGWVVGDNCHPGTAGEDMLAAALIDYLGQ